MKDLYNMPLRKNFHLNFTTSDGVLMFSMKFQQGLAIETLYFNQMSKAQRVSWFLRKMKEYWEYHYNNFLKKHPKHRFTPRKRRLKSIKINIDGLINERIGEYCQAFIEKYHLSHDSIYKDIVKPLAKGEETRRGILGANLMSICKSWNINGLNDLINNYTMEQIEWMADACTFQSYEMTDEGRRANNMLFKDQWYTKQQQDILDKFAEMDRKAALAKKNE